MTKVSIIEYFILRKNLPAYTFAASETWVIDSSLDKEYIEERFKFWLDHPEEGNFWITTLETRKQMAEIWENQSSTPKVKGMSEWTIEGYCQHVLQRTLKADIGECEVKFILVGGRFSSVLISWIPEETSSTYINRVKQRIADILNLRYINWHVNSEGFIHMRFDVKVRCSASTTNKEEN